VANVSRLPAAAIEALRRALAGEALVAAGELFTTERSLPHGHVQAVLGMAGRLGLARLLDRRPSPERARVLAMVCQQVLAPGSKLACTRALAQSTLAEELAVEGVDEPLIGLNPHDNLWKHVMPAYDIDPASLGNVELTLQLRLEAFIDLSGNPAFDLRLR